MRIGRNTFQKIDENYGIKKYRETINYENGVILPKIREVSLWRDTDIKAYQSGVYTLILLLPDDLRKKALNFYNNNHIKMDLTEDGKRDHDDVFVFILQLLEKNGIVFPRAGFELGHD